MVILVAAAAALMPAAVPEARSLAGRLGSASAADREQAARDLAALGPSARAALEEAAASPDPEVRNRARALLALLPDRDAARELRAREAAAVVRAAMASPGGLGRGSVWDQRLHDLAPAAGAALATVARCAAQRDLVGTELACALARHPAAESLAALGEFVRHERMPPSAGLAAARVIEEMSDSDALNGPLVRACAPAAVPHLDEAIRAGSGPTRRAALALLASAVSGDAAPTLIAAADDPDAGVRAEAARALGRIAPAECAAVLRRLAADPVASVRLAALDALADVPGAPEPGPAVTAAADVSPARRPAPARRRAPARLLARDATPDTLPILYALAQDPSPRVRAAADRALRAALGDIPN